MELKRENEFLKEQKYLGNKGFIVFISLLSAFIPLSTDIYLPALPIMSETLHVSSSIINLTLISFFIFYALGTILWGPLSDKYGRKRILIIGILIYTIASFLCALSINAFSLIIWRIFQAIGCGAATAVSTALVKDSFRGKKLITVLALVQSMAMLTPIVSPVIGAIILNVFSWRGAFGVLAFFGILTLLGSIAMQETIETRYEGSIFKSIGKLSGVMKNKNFMLLLLNFFIIAIPLMSFVSASSYIFIDGFGFSETKYSYYFASNAIFFLLGPLSYVKLSKYLTKIPYIQISYIIMMVCGLLMATLGYLNPILFMLFLIPTSFLGSVIRPQTTNFILDQITEDTGSASSVMNCANTLFGCLGMFLISLDFMNKIILMGIMYLLTSVISLALWVTISKKIV